MSWSPLGVSEDGVYGIPPRPSLFTALGPSLETHHAMLDRSIYINSKFTISVQPILYMFKVPHVNRQKLAKSPIAPASPAGLQLPPLRVVKFLSLPTRDMPHKKTEAKYCMEILDRNRIWSNPEKSGDSVVWDPHVGISCRVFSGNLLVYPAEKLGINHGKLGTNPKNQDLTIKNTEFTIKHQQTKTQRIPWD